MGAEIGNSTQKLHARGPDRAARADAPSSTWSKAPGRCASSRFARRDPRRSVQPAAHRSPGLRAGGAVQLELDRVVFMPVGEAPHREIEHDPGAEARLEMVRAGGGGRRALRGVADGAGPDGPSYTGTRSRRCTKESPDDELFLILGGDQAAALPAGTSPRRCSARDRRRCSSGRAGARNAIGIRSAGCRARGRCAISTCRGSRCRRRAIRRRVRHGVADPVPGAGQGGRRHRAQRPVRGAGQRRGGRDPVSAPTLSSDSAALARADRGDRVRQEGDRHPRARPARHRRATRTSS